jgi:hypothetical protein
MEWNLPEMEIREPTQQPWKSFSGSPAGVRLESGLGFQARQGRQGGRGGVQVVRARCGFSQKAVPRTNVIAIS